jgi:hypothetical protein
MKPICSAGIKRALLNFNIGEVLMAEQWQQNARARRWHISNVHLWYLVMDAYVVLCV